MNPLNNPALFRRLMNLWTPYLGAGISVRHISHDWRTVHVSLKRHWFNRNYMGTHFGGSLFAMTDPFYMLMLIRNLGKRYAVWDKSASIEFIKPVSDKVTATFRLNQDRIDRIRRKTANGEKHFEDFRIEVVVTGREVVARIAKTVYIRKKNGPLKARRT